MRTIFEQGRSLQLQTSFRCKTLPFSFEIYGVSKRTSGEGSSQCGHGGRGQSFTIFCGCLFWTVPNRKHIMKDFAFLLKKFFISKISKSHDINFQGCTILLKISGFNLISVKQLFRILDNYYSVCSRKVVKKIKSNADAVCQKPYWFAFYSNFTENIKIHYKILINK